MTVLSLKHRSRVRAQPTRRTRVSEPTKGAQQLENLYGTCMVSWLISCVADRVLRASERRGLDYGTASDSPP